MEVGAFIKRFAAGLSDLEGVPLEVARPHYDALCAGFAPPDPAGMRIEDRRLGGVAVRRFLPDSAKPGTVLFVHGGGFTLGSVTSHHGVAASLAQSLGREVVSVDYRLAPEADYAAMLADCRAVAEAIALVGDSAGGRLVLDLAGTWTQTRADAVPPLGLIYPPLGAPDAAELGPDAPLLSRAEVLQLGQWVAPLSFSPAMPPAPLVEVLAVEHDPLTRPLEAAVAAWRRQGARVGYRCAPGMVHASLHAQAHLPAMGKAWQAFCRALAGHLA